MDAAAGITVQQLSATPDITHLSLGEPNPDLCELGEYLAEPHGRQLLKIVAAEGCELVGASGRRYLDLTSGWNVANLGWSNPVVLDRVLRQMKSLALAPAWCLHDPGVRLARALASGLAGEFAVLRAPTGTQAIEFALRVARRATGRYAVVSVAECYHGSTLGSLAASGIRYLQNEDAPLVSWHRSIPLPGGRKDTVEAIRSTILSEPAPAAVLLEPVLTNVGALDCGREYYDAVFSAARACGALVIMDEVGTGLGRVGRMFGFERWGHTPDLFVLGKSLGGGVAPVAAVVIARRLIEAARGLAFDSTFAGTPAGCEAALATLDLINGTDVLARAAELGDEALRRLQSALQFHPAVRQVRGTGLLLGIEFEAPTRAGQARFANAVVAELLRHDVFAAASRYTHTLLVMPPLTIHARELSRAIDSIVLSVASVYRALAQQE